MAEIDDELRRILEGAGKDITKIREALTGTSKALIKNTDNQKKQKKVVDELIKRNEKLRDHLEENNLLGKEQNEVPWLETRAHKPLQSKNHWGKGTRELVSTGPGAK